MVRYSMNGEPATTAQKHHDECVKDVTFGPTPDAFRDMMAGRWLSVRPGEKQYSALPTM